MNKPGAYRGPRIVLAALLLGALPLSATTAGSRCDEPVAEWKPREMLKSKLEAEGWSVRSIKSSDGCYLADATDSDGSVVQALFDPKTLERVFVSVQDGAG